MAIATRTKQAISELEALGVVVQKPEPDDGKHVSFIMVWANDDCTEYFADYRGIRVREKFENGRFVNPMSYRQDVHEILKRHRLVTEWSDFGQIKVSDNEDTPGWNHGYFLFLSKVDETNHLATVRIGCDERYAVHHKIVQTSDFIKAVSWDGCEPDHEDSPPFPLCREVSRALISAVELEQYDPQNSKDTRYRLDISSM